MRQFTCTLSAAFRAMFVGLAGTFALPAAQFQIGAHNFTLPDGFEIELVAGTNLAPRPIEADFDEQGRLYVTDSSGSNDKPDKQLIDKPHRIVRLEDTDADGRFDKQVVFADKMSFLEGCMWKDGSLYVAAPPSIWKLTDTNNDGVADVRAEWFQGKTLTGCANDLHGPYAGPDGWIYWCKGAFAKQTYTLPNGKEFTTRASHIFRARPDGSGVEPIMTGGMDNPVGLAWSPEGELFLSGTFFQHPAGGKRDGIIHVLYGGVYGKDHDVLNGHPRTGDLLPIMTHLGAAAPCGMVRYESTALGKAFQNNLFVCSFNMHKIVRCVLKPKGATYETTDSDFLVSDNTDFHPTDVLEDADGSLIVVDTGGWYKLCCPTSQLYKPDVLGGIYRVHRKGTGGSWTPRKWKMPSIEALIKNRNAVTDPAVVMRDMPVGWASSVWKSFFDQLAKKGEVAVPLITAISTNRQRYHDEGVRLLAVSALTRIDTRSARDAVRSLIPDHAPQIRKVSIDVGTVDYVLDISIVHAALKSSSLYRDSIAVPKLTNFITWAPDELRAPAAEALGRIGDARAVPALLRALDSGPADMFSRPSIVSTRNPEPNFLHAITYALIEIGDAKSTALGLKSENDLVQRASLIALDQMPGNNLKPEQVTPLLSSSNPLLKQTALWIVEHHAEWGAALASYFEERLAQKQTAEPAQAELQQQLEKFASSPAIQQVLLKTVSSSDNSATQPIALHALARAGVKEMPAQWIPPLVASLRQNDPKILAASIATVRALPAPKAERATLATALTELAERGEVSPAIRVAAAAAVPGGIRQLSEPLYSRLLASVVGEGSVSERADAATALSRAKLSNARLLELAAHMKRVGPMELPRLLSAFTPSTNEGVGLKLIDSLQASKAASSLRPETLKPGITNFPASVQQKADALLASLNTDAAQEKKHIDEMLASVKGGDIRRGQAIFNSPKAACSSCHAIGYLGGNVGPDLTRIGQIRNERDLLEAIVYPSASFVRSYEPVVVSTKSGDDFNGILKKDAADEVVLVTGPNTEQRIARNNIADMRPGSVSVMPSGLADQLSKQEVADLLAFLKATRW